MNSSKKNSFDIVIVTPNLKFIETLEYIRENSILEHDIYLIDNGASSLGYDLSEYKELVKLVMPDCSSRVPKVYNEAFKLTKTDFVVFLHNDTIVLGKGWDKKIERYFTGDIGVIGFCGATEGFATDDIYETPYSGEQLVRIGFRWNFENPEIQEYLNKIDPNRKRYTDSWLHCHGLNLDKECTPVAVVDGLCMVINRTLLEKTDGFDENYIFNGFDEDLCLHALSLGYKNIAINIPYMHLGRGGTEGHIKLREAQNVTEDQLHDNGCRLLYEKWRSLLPVRLKE